MKTPMDITGQKFCRLTAIEVVEKPGKYVYLCRCDCGAERQVEKRHLLSGHTRSCGCLQKEAVSDAALKHGKITCPEYGVWKQMRQRCQNPKHNAYAWYGAKGITVCDAWQKFENFFRDMGARPYPKATLDRIDGTKGYRPGNVRWATRQEQAWNISSNHLIEYKGDTKPRPQWAKEFGINAKTLEQRLNSGWSIAEALETPANAKYRNKSVSTDTGEPLPH